MKPFDFRTFADLVVKSGFPMSPDTVIIDVSHVPDAIPQFGGYSAAMTAPSFPPFNHCFLEQRVGDLGWRGLYTIWVASSYALYVLPMLCTAQGELFTANMYGRAEYANDGHVSQKQPGVYPTEGTEDDLPDPPSHFTPALPIEVIRESMVLAVSSFYLMHQRSELDAVTYTRQQRRQTERKTGKTPSPHYILYVRPGAPRGASGAGKGTGATGSDRSASIVRGHFRMNPPNHPIPQFAGKTFWIPAHQRGEGDAESKIYRILP